MEDMRQKKLKQAALAVVFVSLALISITFSMWQLVAYLFLKFAGYDLPFWTFGPLLILATMAHVWLSQKYAREHEK